jgi:hypothetical protein
VETHKPKEEFYGGRRKNICVPYLWASSVGEKIGRRNPGLLQPPDEKRTRLKEKAK